MVSNLLTLNTDNLEKSITRVWMLVNPYKQVYKGSGLYISMKKK